MPEELPSQRGQLVALVLALQEAMISGYDARGAIVGPDTGPGAVIRVVREQVRLVVRVGVFEELADDGGFVEGFVLVGEGRD